MARVGIDCRASTTACQRARWAILAPRASCRRAGAPCRSRSWLADRGARDPPRSARRRPGVAIRPPPSADRGRSEAEDHADREAGEVVDDVAALAHAAEGRDEQLRRLDREWEGDRRTEHERLPPRARDEADGDPERDEAEDVAGDVGRREEL